MGSPYAGSSSSGGSAYAGSSGGGSVYAGKGGGSSKKKAKKKGGRHGVAGFVQNLGGDIASTAVGLGPGLIHAGGALAADVKDDPWAFLYAPVLPQITIAHLASKDSEVGTQVVRPVLSSYKHTYAPLLPGGRPASDFLKEFYGHPLGVLMDAATVVSFGAAGATKAGLLAKTQRLDLTVGAKTISRDTSLKGAGLDKLLKAVDRATDRIHPGAPKLETARFGLALRTLEKKKAAALTIQARDYAKATKNFSGRDFVATHLLAWGVRPTEYARYLEDMGKAEPTMLKLLADPKLVKLYDEPTAKLLKGAAEARKVSGLGEQVMKDLGLLTDEVADVSVYRHARIVGGAEFLPDIPLIEEKIARLKDHWLPEVQLEADRLQKFLDDGDYSAAAARKAGVPTVLTDPADIRPVPAGHVRLYRGEGETGPIDADVVGDLVADTRGGWFTDTRAIAEHYAEKNNGRVHYVDVPEDQARPWSRIRRNDNDETWTEYQFPAGLGPDVRTAKRPTEDLAAKGIEAIKRDLADKGRPEPFYVPDHAVKQRAVNATLRRQGGGVGVPRLPGSVKQNKGTLMEMGLLALNSDLLGPEFLNRVKLAYHEDLHNRLEETAVRVQVGYKLEPGEQFLRRRVGKTPEKIPYTERIAGDAREQLEADLPDFTRRRKQAHEVFATDGPDAFEFENGDRLVIPQQLARNVGGEFTRASAGVRLLLENPTKVWRHLVLGLRVGFLVNNVVGNHLMYAIKFGGHGALRAYLHMVMSSHGADFVRRMLGSTAKERGGGISRRFIDEIFPDQAQQATFGAQNAPYLGARGRRAINNPALRTLNRAAGLNLLPLTQAVAETGLRRAGVEVALRRSPEVKAALRQIPGDERAVIASLPERAKALLPRFTKQSRDFEAAARVALKNNPALEQRISRQVNDALGDYLSLSAFERNGVRAVFPFYSWYKAITRISVKLAVDNPLKADILQKLTTVDGDFTEGLGPGLQGIVSAGALDPLLGGTRQPGLTTVLSTTGANPYATVAQLGGAAGAAIGLNDQPLGQTLGSDINPFMQSIIEQFSGRDLYTGQPLKRRPLGLIGGTYGNIFADLPQSQIAFPKAPSSVQPQRDRRSTFLAFLGVPLRRMDLERQRDIERDR